MWAGCVSDDLPIWDIYIYIYIIDMRLSFHLCYIRVLFWACSLTRSFLSSLIGFLRNLSNGKIFQKKANSKTDWFTADLSLSGAIGSSGSSRWRFFTCPTVSLSRYHYIYIYIYIYISQTMTLDLAVYNTIVHCRGTNTHTKRTLWDFLKNHVL